MTASFKIAIAGLGTVGGGLLKLIERQDELRLPGRLERKNGGSCADCLAAARAELPGVVVIRRVGVVRDQAGNPEQR